mgnify:CR=1 FL=1
MKKQFILGAEEVNVLHVQQGKLTQEAVIYQALSGRINGRKTDRAFLVNNYNDIPDIYRDSQFIFPFDQGWRSKKRIISVVRFSLTCGWTYSWLLLEDYCLGSHNNHYFLRRRFKWQ